MKLKDIFESSRTTNRNYFDTLENHYLGKFSGDEEKTNRVMDLIRSGDEMAMNYGRSLGSDPVQHVEVGDNGNILIKWIDTERAIFILGIISKTGSIGRADLADMNEWIDRLIEEVKKGKMIHTSVNQSSRLLLERIKRMLDRQNVRYTVNQRPSLVIDEHDPDLVWENVILTPRTHR